MNDDELENYLLNKSKEELVNKLMNIYCRIDSLGHSDVHNCLAYLGNLEGLNKECHNKMYESVNNAFDLCFKIIEDGIYNV